METRQDKTRQETCQWSHQEPSHGVNCGVHHRVQMRMKTIDKVEVVKLKELKNCTLPMEANKSNWKFS